MSGRFLSAKLAMRMFGELQTDRRSESGAMATALLPPARSARITGVSLGYANGEVRVYDRELGKQLGEAVKHPNAITSSPFSPDGETLGTDRQTAPRVFSMWPPVKRAGSWVVKHKSPLVSVDVGRGDLLLTASEDGIASCPNAKGWQTHR